MSQLSSYPVITNLNTTDLVPLTQSGAVKNVSVQSLLGAGPFVTVGTTGSISDYVCDGVNDQVEINAAITAANAAGGGIVLIRAGTYHISVVNTKSNVHVMGEGYATVIQPQAGGGTGWNMNSLSNARLSDIYFDSSIQGNSDGGIIINSSNNVSLDNVWVIGAAGACVKILAQGGATCSKVTLDRCTLTSGGYEDTVFGGPSDAISTVDEVTITRCYIQQGGLVSITNSTAAINNVAQQINSITNNTVQGSIILGGEAIPHLHTTVSNNRVRPPLNSTTCSINLLANSTLGQSAQSQYIIISDNQIDTGHILIQGQGTPLAYTDSVIIANNNILGTSTTSTEVDYGLDLQHLTNVLAVGNLINGSSRGVYLFDVQGINIVSNTAVNVATPLFVSIGAGACSNINVVGNQGISAAVPSTAVSTGTAGQVVTDSSFMYVCTATNTWKRVGIATW